MRIQQYSDINLNESLQISISKASEFAIMLLTPRIIQVSQLETGSVSYRCLLAFFKHTVILSRCHDSSMLYCSNVWASFPLQSPADLHTGFRTTGSLIVNIIFVAQFELWIGRGDVNWFLWRVNGSSKFVLQEQCILIPQPLTSHFISSGVFQCLAFGMLKCLQYFKTNANTRFCIMPDGCTINLDGLFWRRFLWPQN